MKGIIALDIDGTIAIDSQPPEKEIVNFLCEREKEGWQIIFITGRSLDWAKRILSEMQFPHTLSIQNGALTVEMPGGKIVKQLFIDPSLIERADEISKIEGVSYVFYTGDFQDTILWNPEKFDEFWCNYLEERSLLYKENWQVSTHNPDKFTALKWIGEREIIERISQKVNQDLGLHCTAIKDPFNQEKAVAQATHPDATKGEVLKLFREGKKGVVIAAGDDHNDRPLLQAADIKIAMLEAPPSLIELADIVAEEGIIKGLEEAIKKSHDE